VCAQPGRSRKLNTSVISVGNVTMVGAGKTPFVLYLAEQMQRAGRRWHPKPRHGRHLARGHLILEPGERVKVSQSGDEPQIFLRRGVAPVGIGADRFDTGKILQERFGVDILILDDGFQHVRLERQVDIVLIDALAPLGGREVFPLGRLREPLTALMRADVIVITRSESERGTYNLQLGLRRYNARVRPFSPPAVPELDRFVHRAANSGRRIPVYSRGRFLRVGESGIAPGRRSSCWGSVRSTTSLSAITTRIALTSCGRWRISLAQPRRRRRSQPRRTASTCAKAPST
jgi:tetraacyldisaccharide-1-P 4'-kinase